MIKRIHEYMLWGRFHYFDVTYESGRIVTCHADKLPKTVKDFLAEAKKIDDFGEDGKIYERGV